MPGRRWSRSTHARTARTSPAIQSLPAHDGGRGLVGDRSGLAGRRVHRAGPQTDWAGHTTESVTRGIETRNAVFVSPHGQRREFGYGGVTEADDPAGRQHGGGAGRPQVAVGQGTYGDSASAPRPAARRSMAVSTSTPVGSSGHSGCSRYAQSGPHQHRGCAGRSRRRHRRLVSSTASRSTAPTPVLPLAASVYGLRATMGPASRCRTSRLSLTTASPVRTVRTARAADGGSGVAGSLGGEPCTSYIPAGGGTGTGGASNGGKAARFMQQQRARRCGRCRTGWHGRWQRCEVERPTLSPVPMAVPAVAAVPASAGVAGTTAGTAGSGTAGTTWTGNNGGNGSAGTAGRGGGGGGAGGGQSNLLVAVVAMTPAAVAAAAGPPALVAPSERAVPPVAVRSACTRRCLDRQPRRPDRRDHRHRRRRWHRWQWWQGRQRWCWWCGRLGHEPEQRRLPR